MVQGSWVGEPLPIFFFNLFFVLLFLPYERFDCPGWGWVFTLHASIPFLIFTLLTCLSLALMRADERDLGL